MLKYSIIIALIILLTACGRENLYQSTTENNSNLSEGVSKENNSETFLEQEISNLDKTQENGQVWNGIWSRNGHMNEAVLEIESEDNFTITFNLKASDGANAGEISGQATLLEGDKKAIYISKDWTECSLEMENLGEEIEVKVTDACGAFAGNGVVLSGIFSLGELVEGNQTLSDLGVVNEDIDESLRALLKEKYKLLVERMHLVNEMDDIDALNATVLHGGVRGLYTIMEAMIMYDSRGNIWVALLVDDSIEYYTNVDRYKDSLPKTILKWNERFTGKTVKIN